MSVSSYNSDNCWTNDWLIPSGEQSWTIMPMIDSSYAYGAFGITSTGYATVNRCSYATGVIPVAYLKSTVKIKSNPNPDKEYGSIENPFIIQNVNRQYF